VGDSVEKGLALVKEKELKRKRAEDKNEIRFFGQDLSSEEDSSASDSESDNPSTEPPLKKKTLYHRLPIPFPDLYAQCP